MKAFLAACLAAIVLAVIAVIALNSIQEPADRAFTTPTRESAIRRLIAGAESADHSNPTAR